MERKKINIGIVENHFGVFWSWENGVHMEILCHNFKPQYLILISNIGQKFKKLSTVWHIVSSYDTLC